MMNVVQQLLEKGHHMTQIDDTDLPTDLPLDDVSLDDLDTEGDEDKDEKDEAGSNEAGNDPTGEADSDQ